MYICVPTKIGHSSTSYKPLHHSHGFCHASTDQAWRYGNFPEIENLQWLEVIDADAFIKTIKKYNQQKKYAT